VSDFQVTQDAELVADGLHRAAALLGDLEPVNTDAGRIITAAARPPVKTGATASGLFATATPAGVTMASRAPYWTYVHWGAPRRHVRANPWLLAATQATTREVVALYTDHAADSIRTV
jgi:hypothetical protein